MAAKGRELNLSPLNCSLCLYALQGYKWGHKVHLRWHLGPKFPSNLLVNPNDHSIRSTSKCPPWKLMVRTNADKITLFRVLQKGTLLPSKLNRPAPGVSCISWQHVLGEEINVLWISSTSLPAQVMVVQEVIIATESCSELIMRSCIDANKLERTCAPKIRFVLEHYPNGSSPACTLSNFH